MTSERELDELAKTFRIEDAEDEELEEENEI